jgi:hypothetical protein
MDMEQFSATLAAEQDKEYLAHHATAQAIQETIVGHAVVQAGQCTDNA